MLRHPASSDHQRQSDPAPDDPFRTAQSGLTSIGCHAHNPLCEILRGLYARTASVPTNKNRKSRDGLSAQAGKTGLSASRRPMFGEQQRFMLLLVAPAALLLLLFQVVPIVIGANASFRDWTLSNPKKTWVGLAHYINVITDPAFVQVALPNTFLFMFASVTGALVIGLALAILLNRPFRGQKLVQ